MRLGRDLRQLTERRCPRRPHPSPVADAPRKLIHRSYEVLDRSAARQVLYRRATSVLRVLGRILRPGEAISRASWSRTGPQSRETTAICGRGSLCSTVSIRFATSLTFGVAGGAIIIAPADATKAADSQPAPEGDQVIKDGSAMQFQRGNSGDLLRVSRAVRRSGWVGEWAAQLNPG